MNQMDDAAAELKNANDNDSNRERAEVIVTRRSLKVAEIPFSVERDSCFKLNVKKSLLF